MQTLSELSRYWWVLLLRGVLAVIFGLIALFAPGLALASLVLVFGFYAIADGISSIGYAWMHRQRDRWWVGLITGIISIIAGIVAIILPSLAGLTLLTVIAIWAIFLGVSQIIAAIQLRKEIEGEIWMGLSGLLAVIFGVSVILFPAGGALAIASIIGIFAIMYGVFLSILAFRLRGLKDDLTNDNPPDRPYAESY